MWTGFHDRFLALWRQAKGGEAFVAGLFTSPQDEAALDAERRRFLRSLFEDALAFGGLKMIRRILGLAHVEDLESIADPERRAICERKALSLARTLVVEGAKFCRRLRRDRSGARGRARLSRTRPDLWLRRALRAGVDRVERGRAADVEAISAAAAEAQIGARLRHVDLADEVAVGSVAAHPVLLRVAPAHGAPDIAVDVAAHAVGVAGLEILGEDPAVRELAALDVDVEHADMGRVVRPSL